MRQREREGDRREWDRERERDRREWDRERERERCRKTERDKAINTGVSEGEVSVLAKPSKQLCFTSPSIKYLLPLPPQLSP